MAQNNIDCDCVCVGSVIRCIRRLAELLRQMCQAAKAIGNTELENKFSQGACLFVCLFVCVFIFFWCCRDSKDQKRHCICSKPLSLTLFLSAMYVYTLCALFISHALCSESLELCACASNVGRG